MGSEKTPLPDIDPVLVPPCLTVDATPGLYMANEIHQANETTYARMLIEEA